jgi:hypothetical protein
VLRLAVQWVALVVQEVQALAHRQVLEQLPARPLVQRVQATAEQQAMRHSTAQWQALVQVQVQRGLAAVY